MRYTSHAGIARLVSVTGTPLTSTSANRPGGPPAPGPDRLVELFGPEERSGELACARRRCARERSTIHVGRLHRRDA